MAPIVGKVARGILSVVKGRKKMSVIVTGSVLLFLTVNFGEKQVQDAIDFYNNQLLFLI